MSNYLTIKNGHWYLQHEITCSPDALHAWLATLPPIGFIVGRSTVPGKFRLWTVMKSGHDLDHDLARIAYSTHASLHIHTWFVHSDAPYAGMQIACGGNYMVADHIIEKSIEYFEQIQQRCCMHCSVGLGLATQAEYDICQEQNAEFIKGLGLDETPEQTEPEPPPQYAKLGMTKAELLLCAVLDMKLRTQLDDESCPKALALDTFRQVKDLVMKIVKNAPPGMTQVEKFMVVTTLFPNAKLKLARLTPEGELEAFDTGATLPEPPVDDGTLSFGM